MGDAVRNGEENWQQDDVPCLADVGVDELETVCAAANPRSLRFLFALVGALWRLTIRFERALDVLYSSTAIAGVCLRSGRASGMAGCLVAAEGRCCRQNQLCLSADGWAIGCQWHWIPLYQSSPIENPCMIPLLFSHSLSPSRDAFARHTHAYTWELPTMGFPFTPLSSLPFFLPCLCSPLILLIILNNPSLISNTDSHCQQS